MATITRTAADYLRRVLGNLWVNQDAVAAALTTLPKDCQDSITAHTSGTQANGTLLIIGWNRLSVVANDTDAVTLPPSVIGAEVYLVNDGAHAAQVFGAALNPLTNAGDTIDGVATATGVVQATAKRAVYRCITVGNWTSLAGAKTS